MVNLKYTQSLSLRAQNLHPISISVTELCQMPQSPFMMILGLSKNPKKSDVVFQEVMKSVFALIVMCALKGERVNPLWGRAKDEITWTLLLSSGYRGSCSQQGSQNRLQNKNIALKIIAKVHTNPTVNCVFEPLLLWSLGQMLLLIFQREIKHILTIFG